MRIVDLRSARMRPGFESHLVIFLLASPVCDILENILHLQKVVLSTIPPESSH